jgi:hypothetical protein
MDDNTAEKLAEIIKLAPEGAADFIIASYWIGFSEGGAKMNDVAKNLLQEALLDVNQIREAGL